jgi:hypothetical protein
MVEKENGRTAIGLDDDRVVDKGCVLPNSDGSIMVKLGYDDPKRFMKERISWEPKGQEWIDAGTEKEN